MDSRDKATIVSFHSPHAEAARLFQEAYPTILALGRHAGFDEPEQREIAQRVAMVLIEKAHEFDHSKGNARMWAVGIARYVVRDMLRTDQIERSRVERGRLLRGLPSPALTPEETRVARDLLEKVLKSIRPPYRSVIRLDAEGWTASEIAEKLGISRTRVEWCMREGRRDLDATLASLGEDTESISQVREGLFQALEHEGLSADNDWDPLDEEAPSTPRTDHAEPPFAPPGARGLRSRGHVAAPWIVMTASADQAAKQARSTWIGALTAQPVAVAAAVVLAIAGVLASLLAGPSGVDAALVQRSPARTDTTVPARPWVSAPAEPPGSEAVHEVVSPSFPEETAHAAALPGEAGPRRAVEGSRGVAGGHAVEGSRRLETSHEAPSPHEASSKQTSSRGRREMVVTRALLRFRWGRAALHRGDAKGVHADGARPEELGTFP